MMRGEWEWGVKFVIKLLVQGVSDVTNWKEKITWERARMKRSYFTLCLLMPNYSFYQLKERKKTKLINQ